MVNKTDYMITAIHSIAKVVTANVTMSLGHLPAGQ